LIGANNHNAVQSLPAPCPLLSGRQEQVLLEVPTTRGLPSSLASRPCCSAVAPARGLLSSG